MVPYKKTCTADFLGSIFVATTSLRFKCRYDYPLPSLLRNFLYDVPYIHPLHNTSSRVESCATVRHPRELGDLKKTNWHYLTGEGPPSITRIKQVNNGVVGV